MFVARKTSRIIGRTTQFSVSSETRIKKKKKRIKPTYLHSAFNKRKTVLRTRVHLNVIIIFDDPCYVCLYCAHMVCFVEMADDGRAHLDPKNVPTLQCRARGTFVAPYENVSHPPAPHGLGHTRLFIIYAQRNVPRWYVNTARWNNYYAPEADFIPFWKHQTSRGRPPVTADVAAQLRAGARCNRGRCTYSLCTVVLMEREISKPNDVRSAISRIRRNKTRGRYRHNDYV